ncbi:peptidase C15 [Oxynema aestuarii]|jgi:pyroglutamyl-peptidase|uniref:Peptidase C15 n=1 Tax=Oxynema aestuarii AP17 TaxID=2064643 RepID=A0A6H1TUD9_9CYAN|nr:peptidase C15 [Oxynema aestuarii]QIZ70224.1 peptidase C15 [Oxynema aestuarii AP17]RMH77136.1 MAG: peptidase C15 [Cyanobacteria bacterium J007]
MTRTVLLTSFTTWLPHQPSNASDDLLGYLSRDRFATPPADRALLQNAHFLRKLPVDFHLAPQRAIAAIEHLQPEAIVCCGMAETRQKLTLESRARYGDRTVNNPLDLDRLVHGLQWTEISHDAGQFVCERLYYSVLDYLHHRQKATVGAIAVRPDPVKHDNHRRCLFVHVPPLNRENLTAIAQDFVTILQRL